MEDALSKLNEKFLSCNICTEIFKDPCTMECQHTFCKVCLTRYTKTRREAISVKSIQCPNCRQMTKVPRPQEPVDQWSQQFKPSFLIQGLLDTFASQGSSDPVEHHCFTCKHLKKATQAKSICEDCDILLCEACATEHQAIPVSSGHVISPLGAGSTSQLKKRKIMCIDHKCVVEFCCKDCLKAVCPKCGIIYHKKCPSVVTIESMIPEMKQVLQQNSDQINSHIQQAGNTLKSRKSRVEAITQHKSSLQSEIRRVSQQAVDLVRRKEKKLLDELDTLTEKQTKQLRSQIKSGETNMQTFQQYSEFIKQVLQSDSPMDMFDMYTLCQSGEITAEIQRNDIREDQVKKFLFEKHLDMDQFDKFFKLGDLKYVTDKAYLQDTTQLLSTVSPETIVSKHNSIAGTETTLPKVRYTVSPETTVPKVLSPVATETRVRKIISTVATETTVRKVISPVATETTVPKVLSPVATETTVPKVLSPVATETTVPKVISPVATETTVPKILSPVATETTVRKVLSPVATETTVPKVLSPVATETTVPKVLSPVATETTVPKVISPVATETTVPKVISPVATETTVPKVISPVATETRVRKIISTVATETTVRKVISPVATETTVPKVLSPVATETTVPKVLSPVATETTVPKVISPVATETTVPKVISPVATETTVPKVLSPVATETRVRKIISTVATETTVRKVISPVATETTVPKVLSPVATETTVRKVISPVATETTVRKVISPVATETTVPKVLSPVATETTVPKYLSPYIDETTTPKPLATVSAAAKGDINSQFATDIEVLNIGGIDTLVIVDKYNGSVKSCYSKRGRAHCTSLKLLESPNGLTKIGQDRVAVSYFSHNSIELIKLTPDPVLVSSIKTKKKYRCLTALSDTTLAAGCGGPPSIDVLDLSGRVLRSVITPSTGQYLIQGPWYMCTTPQGHIVVTDDRSDSVYCVTQQGEVVYTYKLRGNGVTTTDTGSVIVADWNNDKIIQLTERGEYVRDLLTGQDGINLPYGVCVHENKLYVTEEDSVINVFKF